MSPDAGDLLVWLVSALAVAGVILRPFALGEWIFAVAGAAVLALAGLVPPAAAARAVAAGLDVYLFLGGMMLLAEAARREGLFGYLAARSARAARGSPRRLFFLVYMVGTVVTVFLSNDATAVVLTPAVAAVAQAAEAPSPLPYLLVCAFVANAASFVLPISNPANLVVFGQAMPPLAEWLARLAPAALVSIVATLVLLYMTQKNALGDAVRSDVDIPRLGLGGRIAAIGLSLAGVALVLASAAGSALGWPTATAGALTVVAVLIAERRSPWPLLRGISWHTLALVAGLFVIVRALETTGLRAFLANELEAANAAASGATALVLGLVTAFGTNLTNNLPLGLIGGSVVSGAHVPPQTVDTFLIGIDIGPNLSVTGSLATILWLVALRREKLDFGALGFLRLGIVVMTPALLLSLATRILLF